MSKQSREDFEACLAADAEIRRQIQEEEQDKKYRKEQLAALRSRREKGKK